VFDRESGRGLLGIGRAVNSKSGQTQPASDGICNQEIILDDQDAHNVLATPTSPLEGAG
jgi:hypothetical protein